MIPVSADTLEQIAWDTGAVIDMGGSRDTVTLGDITFAAVRSGRA